MSRQAIKTSLPVRNDYAVKISDIIISNLKNKLGIICCTLGSTGKKPDNEYSGDIDICIEYPYNKINTNIIISHINELYNNPEIYISSGFKIISFGYIYNYENIEDRIVQVDLMFSNDIVYSKFMYHSPNYKNNESKFKGLYRTNLLTFIAGRTPTGIDNIYNENNVLTDYWKYTLTYDNGLKLTHKSYKGKKKLLKNPYTVKEDNKVISMDVNYIIKFILGDNATIKDTNSFESLLNYLYSDNYPYKDSIPDIINDFITDKRHNNEDILNYIKSVQKT